MSETALAYHRSWTSGDLDGAIAGNDAHRSFLLFYCPHTATTSSAPAAEHVTIRDGHIVESWLVFDRLSFVPPQEQ